MGMFFDDWILIRLIFFLCHHISSSCQNSLAAVEGQSGRDHQPGRCRQLGQDNPTAGRRRRVRLTRFVVVIVVVVFVVDAVVVHHLDNELDDFGLNVGDGADVLPGIGRSHLLDGEDVADGIVLVEDRFDFKLALKVLLDPMVADLDHLRVLRRLVVIVLDAPHQLKHIQIEMNHGFISKLQ